MFSTISRAIAVVPAAVTGPALAGSQAQRIGQLFMVGNSAAKVDSRVLSDIANYHVGSVVLTGRSYSETSATHARTGRLRQAAAPLATLGASLLVAAYQEGDDVQTLQGPGFSPRWRPR